VLAPLMGATGRSFGPPFSPPDPWLSVSRPVYPLQNPLRHTSFVCGLRFPGVFRHARMHLLCPWLTSLITSWDQSRRMHCHRASLNLPHQRWYRRGRHSQWFCLGFVSGATPLLLLYCISLYSTYSTNIVQVIEQGRIAR